MVVNHGQLMGIYQWGAGGQGWGWEWGSGWGWREDGNVKHDYQTYQINSICERNREKCKTHAICFLPGHALDMNLSAINGNIVRHIQIKKASCISHTLHTSQYTPSPSKGLIRPAICGGLPAPAPRPGSGRAALEAAALSASPSAWTFQPEGNLPISTNNKGLLDNMSQ